SFPRSAWECRPGRSCVRPAESPGGADAERRRRHSDAEHRNEYGRSGSGGRPGVSKNRAPIMSQSANVRSVEAIAAFRVAVTNAADDARNALGGTEMEIRRMRDWLQRAQLTYWQGQIKRRNELLSRARTELHRRRLQASNSDAISDTEQKE